MKTLLQNLIKKNIHLSLNNGELSVKVPKTGVDPEIINEIRANKQNLISYLSKLTNPSESDIVPLDIQENYSVSYSQERIWNQSLLLNGSSAYNIPGTIEMGIAIDQAKFIKAVQAVIDRHEVLRTVFRINAEGELRQQILPREALPFEIQYIDLSQKKNKEELIGAYINTDAFVPFDLENGPLFRGTLFCMDKEQYVFYYNMHSIISDGESIEIFTREAMEFFQAFSTGRSIGLPDLNIQYKDFAVWQTKRAQDDELREHRAYWMEYLSGELPKLSFEGQKERPKEKTFNGKLLGANLSSETTDKLKKFVSDNKGHLFAGIVASWKVFIYQYTKQQDVIIGIPALGRDHSDLDGQLGPYINNIPIRNFLNPKESFLEFYNQVKANMLKSNSFQMYRSEKLASDLGFKTAENRNPLFDMFLVLQREQQVLEDFQLSGINTGTILEGGIGKKYVDTIVSKYDLEIDFRELGGCLWFNVNYNVDIFEKEFIIDLMTSYKKFLNNLLDNYKSRIESILRLDVSSLKFSEHNTNI